MINLKLLWLIDQFIVYKGREVRMDTTTALLYAPREERRLGIGTRASRVPDNRKDNQCEC